MKVLVLGGTGAMGAHLVDLLMKEPNCQVVVTSRSQHKNKENVTYVQGNALEWTFLATLLERKFDVIVDFMGYRTKEFQARYQQLLNACGQYVYLSSSRVYADSITPIVEDSPRLLDVINDSEYLATDEYALAKARQENLLRDSRHTNWTIIRPYITYSETRLQLGVLEKESWLYRALHSRMIVFSDDIAERQTTLTYGFDVARAMKAIIGQAGAFGEAFHITASDSIRWQEVLNIYLDVLAKKTGKSPKVLMTSESINLRHLWRKYQVKYDRLFNRRFDNTKINNFIDTKTFVGPREGLRECIERFMEQPSFRVINYVLEAQLDRLTKEHTPLWEINTLRNRMKYVLYRYFVKNNVN